MGDQRIEVSVQASPCDAGSWIELARRCEHIGARALLVSDHPGSGPSPFVALAAAAGVTSGLRLGSYVVNAGVREPLLLAADVATLDVVSNGRTELGIGAGHTPSEWEMTGHHRPPAAARVQRLKTVATAVRRLLDGDTVPATDLASSHDVVLDKPQPVQRPVPLLAGGANSELLRWAGAHADAVGLTGLGRTMPDGHSHAVSWSGPQVDTHVEHVRRGAEAAGVAVPALEALVQQVIVTEDREAAAAPLAEELDLPVEHVLAVPYLWIGTLAEILDQLHTARDRWGITRWVVRPSALDAVTGILAAL